MCYGLTEDEIEWIEKNYNLFEGKEQPLALWIIGRPAAGKTTTALLLRDALQQAGHSVGLVDGDIVRAALDGSLGYSPKDRQTVFMKYIYINQLLQKKGIIPITATIAGFHYFQEIVFNSIENPKIIYLDCPFDVAAKRDQKGHYEKALNGKMKNFFGVDIPFEVPIHYEMKIESVHLKPFEIVARIMEHFAKSGLLSDVSDSEK